MSETKLSSTPDELEKLFMDPNRAKTEAEHWAVREIDRLRAELDRTREQLNAAVALIAWDYWNGGASEWSHSGGDNHYKEARWGKGILRSLIDAEIAKLEPLEGEP